MSTKAACAIAELRRATSLQLVELSVTSPEAMLFTRSTPTSLELKTKATEAARCLLFLGTKAPSLASVPVFKAKQTIRM